MANENDISGLYSFRMTSDNNGDDNGKKFLCCILSFILSILFLIVSIFWVLDSPVRMVYYNYSEKIPITLPDQQIFIDTNQFFACECVMYNLTFIIISPCLFSITSNNTTYNVTNITNANDGLYYANVTDNDGGINYFDMTITLRSNILKDNITHDLVINGYYGTLSISPIALLYSIPMIVSLIIMIYSLYKITYYCRIRNMVRKEYLTSTLVFHL